MLLGELGEQVMIRSRKAFDRIRFTGNEHVGRDIYYPKKKQRDINAAERFRTIANRYDKGGIYVIQLIDGMIDQKDERLHTKLFI